jgi:hypothetical protein
LNIVLVDAIQISGEFLFPCDLQRFWMLLRQMGGDPHSPSAVCVRNLCSVHHSLPGMHGTGDLFEPFLKCIPPGNETNWQIDTRVRVVAVFADIDCPFSSFRLAGGAAGGFERPAKAGRVALIVSASESSLHSY